MPAEAEEREAERRVRELVRAVREGEEEWVVDEEEAVWGRWKK